MNFAEAFAWVLSGKRARRRAWNVGESIFLVEGSTFEVSRHPLDKVYEIGTPIKYQAHVDKASCGGMVEVYTPTQIDLMACDWIVIEELSQLGQVMPLPISRNECINVRLAA
jgi:hypothetical protein